MPLCDITGVVHPMSSKHTFMCKNWQVTKGKFFNAEFVKSNTKKCFLLKSWHHTWNDPRIKSKTSRSSVFTCSGMNAKTMKLIPNSGIKSSVDFASLLKRQSRNGFTVRPISNLSPYMPIMKCNCGALCYFTFQLWGPEMEKNTMKRVGGKIAHALRLAYEMLSITGKKNTQSSISLCKAAARGSLLCWVPRVSFLKS